MSRNLQPGSLAVQRVSCRCTNPGAYSAVALRAATVFLVLQSCIPRNHCIRSQDSTQALPSLISPCITMRCIIEDEFEPGVAGTLPLDDSMVHETKRSSSLCVVAGGALSVPWTGGRAGCVCSPPRDQVLPASPAHPGLSFTAFIRHKFKAHFCHHPYEAPNPRCQAEGERLLQHP